jgi:transposase-like protein
LLSPDSDPEFWTGGTREKSGKTPIPSAEALPVRKRHSPEQIAAALRAAEAGTPVAEIIQQLGIDENTFYTWKRRFGGLGTPEIRELRQLREENAKLKSIVADLSLDRKMPQEIIKKTVKPAQQRDRVGFLRCTFGMGIRRACDLIRLNRATYYCKSTAGPLNAELRERIKAIAAARIRYGYRRIGVLLRREGLKINDKRVYRLYALEGLSLRAKMPHRPRRAPRRASPRRRGDGATARADGSADPLRRELNRGAGAAGTERARLGACRRVGCRRSPSPSRRCARRWSRPACARRSTGR